MTLIDRDVQPTELWREGVETVMIASARMGASQLTVFEQRCAPGTGAPIHRHAVEEVLCVLRGEAAITVDDETITARAGHSVVVPAGRWHGFSNVGGDVLLVRATLAAPMFEAQYRDGTETPRRWAPD